MLVERYPYRANIKAFHTHLIASQLQKYCDVDHIFSRFSKGAKTPQALTAEASPN
jgi:hypothetical protein